MKSIMISIKPKWCALIMNGEKTIEVRKNKALASAIQKLINDNGYADIYVYCSKDKKHKLEYCDIGNGCWCANDGGDYYNGKVVFKFRCYKVEEIPNYGLARRSEIMMEGLLKKSCLNLQELNEYAPHKEYEDDSIYAIHISDLEIFDKPKELNEFNPLKKTECDVCKRRNGIIYCPTRYENIGSGCIRPLTKAPQNFCYIEGELE